MKKRKVQEKKDKALWNPSGREKSNAIICHKSQYVPVDNEY